jgi:hypothetical protein
MRFKSVFVSLFIALGLVATAVPAQAGRGPVPPTMVQAGRGPSAPPRAALAMQGPAGYLTFWNGCPVGYCDATWVLAPTGGIGVCHALPTGAANHPSAFSNNSGHNFRVWTGAGCTGSSATLYNGTETGDLAAPYDNNLESQQRIS